MGVVVMTCEKKMAVRMLRAIDQVLSNFQCGQVIVFYMCVICFNFPQNKRERERVPLQYRCVHIINLFRESYWFSIASTTTTTTTSAAATTAVSHYYMRKRKKNEDRKKMLF